MVTKQEAVASRYGQILEHASSVGHTGKPRLARVNGRCMTWVTRPTEFRLPIKAGLYEHGYITHENAASWSFQGEEK